MISSTSLAGSSASIDLLEHLPKPLILGSGSFTRKLILREMGIDFLVVKRPIDERGIGDRDQDTPHDLVLMLAKAKMNHLVEQIEKGNCQGELESYFGEAAGKGPLIVLTGDQVVTHDGKILEKPESIEEAKAFCQGYAMSPPSTVGACVIHHIPTGIQVSGVDTATIYFRPSIADFVEGKDLIDRLLEDKAPILECAGGLMIEHDLVREHVEDIDGTEDSVMGLSKVLVERLLNELRGSLDATNSLAS
ncbi:Maf-like protein [Fragilaria crotonensis]|nr:Maf-like protein [Fragilaria crotonensis]